MTTPHVRIGVRTRIHVQQIFHLVPALLAEASNLNIRLHTITTVANSEIMATVPCAV